MSERTAPKPDLWFEFSDGRELRIPSPSHELIASMTRLDPPKWKTESKRAFLDRAALLLEMIIAAAVWKSAHTQPGALPVEPNSIRWGEARQIIIAVMTHAAGMDANLALRVQKARDEHGRFPTDADGFTVGDLRRAADPLMPL